MLIKACLNGSRTRLEHPAIPVSPPELALEAHHAMLAGAGAVHVHPRAADTGESLEPHTVRMTLEAIRRSCPALPVGVTTAAWIEPDPERRRWLIGRWDVPPDFASVNLSEEGAGDVGAALLDRGIGVEAGLAEVEDAGRLAAVPWTGRCLRVLVEVDEEEDPARAVTAATAIDEALDQHGIEVPRLHHGTGRATWAVIERAIDLGRDVRVGLEDTLVLPDGSPARDNAHLVATAVALARSRVHQ